MVTYNTLIDVYGKMGRWQDAVQVLDDMTDKVGLLEHSLCILRQRRLLQVCLCVRIYILLLKGFCQGEHTPPLQVAIKFLFMSLCICNRWHSAFYSCLFLTPSQIYLGLSTKSSTGFG